MSSREVEGEKVWESLADLYGPYEAMNHTLSTSPDALTKIEVRDLEQLESVIQSSLSEMESAGKALIEIRDRKLYRAEFGTFKEYVSVKWEMSWKQAYRLCDAADVVANIKESVQLDTFPTHESQARELSKLEPEEQVKVWTEAVKAGNTSARGIAEAVEVILPDRAKIKREPQKRGSYSDWQKFRTICIQIDEAVDELAELQVDAPHEIIARDTASRISRKLEKVINSI